MNKNDPPSDTLPHPATDPSPPAPPLTVSVARLTPRQRAVLAQLLAGQSNKLIGRQLGLTTNTTKDHVAATLKRLGLRKRADVLRHAHQLKALLTAEDNTATPHAAEQDPAAAPLSTPTHYGKLPDLGLTDRQLAVLMRLLEGLPNKEIAEQMGLSVYTVKEYVSEILKRLGVRTRFEVISLVQGMGKQK